ncbi:sugar phosphate isomerase/epimerase, partial [Verrucomicrobiales bacterium]|nr:sugar phosphate isomerase/epimerase [Verrucomicrobiales bacterium]
DVRTKAIADFTQALHDCKEYGGTTVLLYPGVVNKGTRYGDAYDRLLDCVKQLVPAARETGIKIALENVWNNIFLTPLEASEFLDDVNAPGEVGWYLDIGNLVAFGWPEHWIHHLGGDRIFKVDVKEYSRKRQREEGSWKGFQVPLLEGDCDWPTVMKALDEVGYQGGWFAAEVRGGNAKRLAEINNKLDQIIAL